MKVIKTASGKKRIKINKSEWKSIGKTAGWLSGPSVPAEGEFGFGLDAEAMGLLAKYQLDQELFKYDTPNSGYPELYEGIQAAKQGNNEALRQALVNQYEK